eukprot:SAG31_NODE_1249_length_9118_cov_23.165318_2_plen_112_part_00
MVQELVCIWCRAASARMCQLKKMSHQPEIFRRYARDCRLRLRCNGFLDPFWYDLHDRPFLQEVNHSHVVRDVITNIAIIFDYERLVIGAPFRELGQVVQRQVLAPQHPHDQ